MSEGLPVIGTTTEANPVELAEYAVNHGIDKEPAFHWWVPFVLRKRNRIIKKMQSKY